MKIDEICRKHPGCYPVISANERDDNDYVSDWNVISTDSKSFKEAVETKNFYQSNGVAGLCIISTYDAEGTSDEAKEAARFFRIYFGVDKE